MYLCSQGGAPGKGSWHTASIEEGAKPCKSLRSVALSPPQPHRPINRQTTQGFLTPLGHHFPFSTVSSTPRLPFSSLCPSVFFLSVRSGGGSRLCPSLLPLPHIASPVFPPLRLPGCCFFHGDAVCFCLSSLCENVLWCLFFSLTLYLKLETKVKL